MPDPVPEKNPGQRKRKLTTQLKLPQAHKATERTHIGLRRSPLTRSDCWRLGFQAGDFSLVARLPVGLELSMDIHTYDYVKLRPRCPYEIHVSFVCTFECSTQFVAKRAQESFLRDGRQLTTCGHCKLNQTPALATCEQPFAAPPSCGDACQQRGNQRNCHRISGYTP